MKPGTPTAAAFTRWTGKFIDLLFPSACAACGSLGPAICNVCLSRFLPIAGPSCQRCGRQTTENVAHCSHCRSQSYCLDQARACFSYTEPLVSVIKRYKYDGLFSLARPLGLQMVRHWPDWQSAPDVIVPVPLHAWRRHVRGFNQASLLAQELGTGVDIEVNERLLKRIRYTKPQVSLSPAKRPANVAGAFSADSSDITGARILLVDDVLTTGSTMLSAARTLQAAGAKSVSAYCLARAVQ
jgi:ComF family protein